MINYVYLYLLSPLHTGGTTQEGNLLGIARESHTNLPYIPSSTIRGRLRASVTAQNQQFRLFGTDLKNSQQLEQGDIWIGDASILWLPVPSLSHSVIWISCPMLLRRWLRFNSNVSDLPPEYSCNFTDGKSAVYLKDAILKADQLKQWQDWQAFVPQTLQTNTIERLLILPDRHCSTLIQMSLWRQVKVIKAGQIRRENEFLTVGFSLEGQLIHGRQKFRDIYQPFQKDRPDSPKNFQQLFQQRLKDFYAALTCLGAKVSYRILRTAGSVSRDRWAEAIDANCCIVVCAGKEDYGKPHALAVLHSPELKTEDEKYNGNLCGKNGKPSPVWIADLGKYQVVTVFGATQDPRKNYLQELRDRTTSQNYIQIFPLV